jgi:hypothetical protein
MRARAADLADTPTIAFVLATSTRITGDQSPNSGSPRTIIVGGVRGPLHQAGRSRGMLGDGQSEFFACV